MSVDTGRAGTDTAEPQMGPLRAEGLFVPELALGAGHTHPDDAAAISAYFAAVAAQRPAPLCPATAWNALFYGWDLESGSYTGWGLDVSQAVRHHGTGPAVPVGAFVMVSRGADSVWGEVVYKEGRHPDIDPEWGDVPPAVSGGAAMDSWSATGPVRVVHEALVVDFDALGGLRDAGLERLARQGKHLDPLGHVVIEAIYDPPADAEASDTVFFARWLWATQRPVLRDSWLGACLEDRNDDEALWAALIGSLEAVDAILDSTPGLAAWGPYRYPETAFWARSADLPLGPADGASITHRLANPARERIAYRTMRHQLVELLGDGDAEIRFAAYATAVCHANRMVADTLAAEAPAGVLLRAGGPVHLRLDDLWQSGGVWRAERLDRANRCPLLDVDPTEPLGLGATGEAADVHIDVPEPQAPVAPPSADDTTGEEGEPDLNVTVEDSHVHWVAALGVISHREGTFRVPGAVPAGEVILRLAHDGDISDDERVQRLTNRDGRLRGIAWPFDFYPGIRLWCVTVPGSPVVHAATAMLAEPIIVDGEERWFASDPERTAPSPSGARGPGPATLADLAVNALRRHGIESDDGRRSLTTDIVTELIFGPGFDPVVTDLVGAALERCGRAQRSGGRWSVTAPRHARGGGLFGAEPNRTGGGYARLHAGVRRAHWVPVHLRRLTVSDRANAERRAQWPAVRAQAANRHALPERLPDGYTYVVSHRRGTR